VLILVKHLLAAASVASVFPFKEREETSVHRGYTEIFSQAPWKEKCYNRNSRAIGVDAVDHFFHLLPCQSLSLSLLLVQRTKRSAFSLRFHEHTKTILSMTSKMSKIR